MYDKMTAGPASSRAATPAESGKARRVSVRVRHAAPGSRRCRRACEHEDACADDASDAEQHQVESAQNLRRALTRGHSPAFVAQGGRALRQPRAFFMPPGSAARATASSTFFRRTALARKRDAYASNARRRGPMPPGVARAQQLPLLEHLALDA